MALSERIINMYEAALRGFNMVKSEGVRHAAKLEAVGVVERRRVESDDSVPTALHRYRMA